MRRPPLQVRPPVDHSGEPGYRAWHAPIFGCCAVCSQPGRLVRHHVVTERHVREAGGDPFDMRNSLALGMHCRCHRDHHGAARRLPLAKLPGDAVDFCTELYGEGAGDYLARYYAA